MLESGERSSWDASATNCRWRSREPSSRASIWFMVVASRWISSREAGSGTRRSSWSPEIWSTSARIRSTGASARVATIQVVPPTRSSSSGRPTSSGGSRAEVESSTSSSETATVTSYSPASSVATT